MPTASCPYCQAAYVERDGKCDACGADFPWAAEVKRLREEMKERETNRGRATFHLIDEALAAARDRRPISVSALKGFAFAWLFPRALIVVGSLVTGLVLGLQTWILWNQTSLLEAQASAARTERAERLRDRIGRQQLIIAKLSGLQAAISRADAVNGCEESCASRSWPDEMSLLIQRLNGGPVARLPDRQRGSGIAWELERLSRLLDDLYRGTESQVTLPAQRPDGNPLLAFVADAQIRCRWDQSPGTRLRLSIIALHQWRAIADGTSVDRMGALQTLQGITRDRDSALRQEVAGNLSQQHFFDDVSRLIDGLGEDLRNLDQACEATLDEDIRALATLERSWSEPTGTAR